MLTPARTAKKAFTLIELLVVIVILGVLAGIVVFSVGSITDRGNAAACDADYKTVETAQEARFAKSGAYADEATLVSEKFLRAESTLHNTTTSGAVTVAAGSGC